MAGWMGFGLARAREGFCARQDEETWCSPRIRADMSAALVDMDENWKTRPGYSFSEMP